MEITWNNYIGNSVIVAKIRNMLDNNNLPKQVLFSGASGVGKTTLAKLIAAQLDAYVKIFNVANTTGIDSVRQDIINECKRIPLGKKHIVFILDEIHKFSAPAQECLLTPLEDDTTTFFIGCTTEPSKIKKTLLKRFTCFKLNSPTETERITCSKQIAELQPDVLSHIVKNTTDLRTVTKMTELCIGHNLEEAKILCASYTEDTEAIDIVKQLMKTDLKVYYSMLKKYGEDGGNWQTLLMLLINYYTAVLTNRGKAIDMTQNIYPGTEKARVYYLISQIREAL